MVISSRTQSDLDAVVAQIADDGGAPAMAVVADATDRDDARRPVLEAIERLGRVDVLVNNVGGTIGRHHDPFTGDDESFERTLTLNLTSAWWTTREALPGMRERGFGRIISIGSGASKHAAASLSYTTAKHGLVGFTKQLAQITGAHRHHREPAVPGLDQHVAPRLRGGRRAAPARLSTKRSNRPNRRARSTVCSSPRSSRAWRPCSRPTTAPVSPARSSPSTAATASDRRCVRTSSSPFSCAASSWPCVGCVCTRRG